MSSSKKIHLKNTIRSYKTNIHIWFAKWECKGNEGETHKSES